MTEIEIKKATRIFVHHLSCDGTCSSLSHYGGRHSGGGRGITEAPGSVITMYWRIIYEDFTKNQGLKEHFNHYLSAVKDEISLSYWNAILIRFVPHQV